MRFNIAPPLAAVILAVVLFALSGLLPNGFGTDSAIALAQATNILRLAVFLGVVAAGQTLVILSGGEGIDLSAGAVVTLAAAGALLWWAALEVVSGVNPFRRALGSAVAAVTLVGLLTG